MLSKSLPRVSAFQAKLVLAVEMLLGSVSASDNPRDMRVAGDRWRERGSDRSAKKNGFKFSITMSLQMPKLKEQIKRIYRSVRSCHIQSARTFVLYFQHILISTEMREVFICFFHSLNKSSKKWRYFREWKMKNGIMKIAIERWISVCHPRLPFDNTFNHLYSARWNAYGMSTCDN